MQENENEGKVHGRLNASWKISSLAVNGQSFLVIDGYLWDLVLEAYGLVLTALSRDQPGITKKKIIRNPCKVMLILQKFWFSGDIILFPDEYNSILIRTEINVPEIPKMNADNK